MQAVEMHQSEVNAYEIFQNSGRQSVFNGPPVVRDKILEVQIKFWTLQGSFN